MKKKNRFSVPSKYIFAALALLCVGMMFASYSTGFAGSTLGRISGYVFVPFERGINTVGGWLRSRADSLEDLADAQAKNEELQSQVDELTLENSRLMQNQYRLEELEELYALVKTKRYPLARLRRLLLHSYLGVRPARAGELPPYLRVLGANERGRKLLRRMTAEAVLPVVARPASARALGPEARALFDREVRCTDLYTLAYPRLEASVPGSECLGGPVML